MLIFVDVDGTIIDRRMVSTDGINTELVSRVNKLFDSGRIIVVLTHRPIHLRALTIGELGRAGLKYHGIINADARRLLDFKCHFIGDVSDLTPIIIDDDQGIRNYAVGKGWTAISPEEFIRMKV